MAFWQDCGGFCARVFDVSCFIVIAKLNQDGWSFCEGHVLYHYFLSISMCTLVLLYIALGLHASLHFVNQTTLQSFPDCRS